MSIKDLQLNNVTVASPSDTDRIRYPEIVFTDGYLDDPIQFRPDDRFELDSLVQQSTSLPNQLNRDFAEFLQIDRNNDSPQLLTVNMYSTITRRDLFMRVLGPRAQFKELGVTR